MSSGSNDLFELRNFKIVNAQSTTQNGGALLIESSTVQLTNIQ